MSKKVPAILYDELVGRSQIHLISTDENPDDHVVVLLTKCVRIRAALAE